MKKSVIAVVPARHGSKGLSRKNVLDLGGKPLLVWTVDAIIEAGIADKVIVTTDIPDIQSLLQRKRVGVLVRPDILSGDNVPMSQVLKHVVEENPSAETIILLQPTSPLRNSADIVNAFTLFEENDKYGVISVCKVSENPEWMFEIQQDGALKPFMQGDYPARQQLSDLYVPNGAIYISDKEMLCSNGYSFRNIPMRPFVMPQNRSVDIDDINDLEYARFLLANNA